MVLQMTRKRAALHKLGGGTGVGAVLCCAVEGLARALSGAHQRWQRAKVGQHDEGSVCGEMHCENVLGRPLQWLAR